MDFDEFQKVSDGYSAAGRKFYVSEKIFYESERWYRSQKTIIVIGLETTKIRRLRSFLDYQCDVFIVSGGARRIYKNHHRNQRQLLHKTCGSLTRRSCLARIRPSRMRTIKAFCIYFEYLITFYSRRKIGSSSELVSKGARSRPSRMRTIKAISIYF